MFEVNERNHCVHNATVNSERSSEEEDDRMQSPGRISADLDIPGGVITTHCVSSVIKPGSKQNHDPLQFVKIQSNELSRKAKLTVRNQMQCMQFIVDSAHRLHKQAVEQIRLAEEVKITKEKIKEVEEEWQNNLLNWKSKRRQTRGNQASDENEGNDQQTRKIKTFSEIIKEKAKSGHRIGYNLDKYIETDGDEFETDVHFVGNGDDTKRVRKDCGLNRLDNESQFNVTNRGDNVENVDLNNSNNHNARQTDNVYNRDNFCYINDLKCDAKRNDSNNKDKKRESKEWRCDTNEKRAVREEDSLNRSYASQSDTFSDDDDDEDEMQDSDEDKEMEEQQILSFKAKLSAFENLAKPVVEKKCSNARNTNLVKIEPWKRDERNETRLITEFESHLSNPVTQIRPQTTTAVTDDLLPRGKQSLLHNVFGHKSVRQDESQELKVHQSCENADYDSEINEISERILKSNCGNARVNQSDDCLQTENGCHRSLESSRQYDQKQYYLLDDVYTDKPSSIPCNREMAVNSEQQPLYGNAEQFESLVQQQQRKPEKQLSSHSLPQSNHCLYYGAKHASSPQLNVGHQYASKPVPQTRHTSIQCPQQQQQQVPHPRQYLYPHPSHSKPMSASQSQLQIQQPSPYNLNHWIIQEAELRRQIAASNQYQPKPVAAPRMNKPPPPPPPVDDDMHLYENSPLLGHIMQQQEQQKQQKRMLSVSGRKKCSSCGDELGRGCAAMVIESLSLYYHINCFRCSVCHIQLGNGTCGTDVRVRNNKLHCKNCYSNDEG